MAILSLSLFNPIKSFGYNDESPTRKISVDKKVRDVGSTQYYDNIESSSKTFLEKDQVEFQITVKNVSTDMVYNINIKDMLPKNLSMIFYPGKFDSDQYIVEWDLKELKPNESKTYLIRAKVKNAAKLNVLTKQTNKAEACGGGTCDADYASYFIGNKGNVANNTATSSAKTIPDTGASDIFLKTGIIALIAGLGLTFRKKARN